MKEVTNWLFDKVNADLLTKENLEKCDKFIYAEAKKIASKQVAIVQDEVIYNWAKMFFEQKLYEAQEGDEPVCNAKISHYIPSPFAMKQPVKKVIEKQVALFDFDDPKEN